MSTHSDSLRNSFHGTEIRIRDAARTMRLLSLASWELSRSERAHVRRVRDALCGSSACTCGVVRS